MMNGNVHSMPENEWIRIKKRYEEEYKGEYKCQIKKYYNSY